MEGLKRSEISFRRQGSSGLVWDDKLISEELNRDKDGDNHDQKIDLRRSKSDGGGAKRESTYRTVKVQQAEDPPSPRLSACGFCSVFGGKTSQKSDNNNKKKSAKPKHR